MSSGPVAIGYVHPADVSAYFADSLVRTMVADAMGPRRIVRGGARIAEFSGALIANARNAIVRRFLDDTAAEWLLMVDADMVWQPDDVTTLLEYADPKRAPIVGGLCFGVDAGNLFPTLYALAEDGDGYGVRRYDTFPENAMFQVTATGAAFLLVHRMVYEAVRDRAFNATFPWFQETEMNGRGCGEDFTFCLRAGMCGFPVHVHTGVEVGHHKSYVLTADMYRQQRAQKEA